jgi:hypothetical protein
MQHRHKANYSPPSNAKVKNPWNYASTTPYIFTVWYFFKQKTTLPLYILLQKYTGMSNVCDRGIPKNGSVTGNLYTTFHPFGFSASNCHYKYVIQLILIPSISVIYRS